MAHCLAIAIRSDANENALKLVRPGNAGARPGIIAFRGCFHGRTAACRNHRTGLITEAASLVPFQSNMFHSTIAKIPNPAIFALARAPNIGIR